MGKMFSKTVQRRVVVGCSSCTAITTEIPAVCTCSVYLQCVEIGWSSVIHRVRPPQLDVSDDKSA